MKVSASAAESAAHTAALAGQLSAFEGRVEEKLAAVSSRLTASASTVLAQREKTRKEQLNLEDEADRNMVEQSASVSRADSWTMTAMPADHFGRQTSGAKRAEQRSWSSQRPGERGLGGGSGAEGSKMEQATPLSQSGGGRHIPARNDRTTLQSNIRRRVEEAEAGKKAGATKSGCSGNAHDHPSSSYSSEVPSVPRPSLPEPTRPRRKATVSRSAFDNRERADRSSSRRRRRRSFTGVLPTIARAQPLRNRRPPRDSPVARTENEKGGRHGVRDLDVGGERAKPKGVSSEGALGVVDAGDSFSSTMGARRSSQAVLSGAGEGNAGGGQGGGRTTEILPCRGNNSHRIQRYSNGRKNANTSHSSRSSSSMQKNIVPRRPAAAPPGTRSPSYVSPRPSGSCSNSGSSIVSGSWWSSGSDSRGQRENVESQEERGAAGNQPQGRFQREDRGFSYVGKDGSPINSDGGDGGSRPGRGGEGGRAPSSAVKLRIEELRRKKEAYRETVSRGTFYC